MPQNTLREDVHDAEMDAENINEKKKVSGPRWPDTFFCVEQTGVEPVSKNLSPVLLLS